MTEPKPLTIPLVIRPRQYIQALQNKKVSVERIAEAMGLTVRMIHHMKEKNLEPRWSNGLRLIELHAQYCGSATAQKDSLPR